MFSWVHLGPWVFPQVKHWKPSGNDERDSQLKKPRVFPSKKNRAALFFPWFLSSFSHGNCLSDIAMVFFSNPPGTSIFHGQGFAC